MLPALQHFAESLPRRPYCTDDPHMGQSVRGRVEALKFCNVQPNTSGKVVWLAFDVDHSDGATSWDRLNAPPPTLAVGNPANGHAHLLYALEVPVPRTEAARMKPLLYLAAAQEGIRRKLGADPGYSGHLCKNPLHERWQTQQWAGTYSLADLSEWVDLPRIADMKKRVRDPDYAGLGRNCELFERVRPLAYSLVRRFWLPGGFEAFRDALRILADDFNAGFGEPLPLAEARAISASCARWVWKNFDPASFRAIQAKRGARKGVAKREALIRALYHHDGTALLGTTRGGTLQLRETPQGLAFELALPDTTHGRDLAILVDRGDVAGCSFGFKVPDGGDRWEERGSTMVRELLTVDLVEITLTSDPAYSDTTVALRSMPTQGFVDLDNRQHAQWWLDTCK